MSVAVTGGCYIYLLRKSEYLGIRFHIFIILKFQLYDVGSKSLQQIQSLLDCLHGAQMFCHNFAIRIDEIDIRNVA